MKSITFLTMKGGDGKSTCSINVAAWFSGAGEKVHLSDSDVNRHCVKWYERAKLNPKYEPSFTVSGVASVGRYLRDCEMLVMDTMANITPDQVGDYVEASDLIVIPMRPCIDSYGPVLETVEAIANRCPYRILLNACPSRSPDIADFRQDMEEDGFQLFQATIRQSIGIPRASMRGIPVSEMTGNYRLAALDFDNLCKEIQSILE